MSWLLKSFVEGTFIMLTKPASDVATGVLGKVGGGGDASNSPPSNRLASALQE